MVTQLVVAVLALSCLSAAASKPDCKELVKPLSLEDRSSVLGKRIFTAGTSDTEDSLKGLKNVISSWVEQSLSSDGTFTTLRTADKIHGKCIYKETNMTNVGNTTLVTFMNDNCTYTHDGEYLETCPECVLWSDTAHTSSPEGTKESRNLFLFTKSGKLEDSYLEVFKQQAACLNFTVGIHMANVTDLCPDEKQDDQQ